MVKRDCPAILLLCLVAAPAFAASYVVPTDRFEIERSHAIVVGHVLSSHVEKIPDFGIETVTDFIVEDTVKGDAGLLIQIHEAGGVLGYEARLIPGMPRFTDGERMVLFLYRRGNGDYLVNDLALGSFRFVKDVDGQDLLIRNESEVNGQNANGTPHKEMHRLAAQFIDYIRGIVRGDLVAADYVVPAHPFTGTPKTTAVRTQALHPISNTVFTATSYTLSDDGTENGPGARWNVFPSAVNWNQGNSEPGAPGSPAGSSAITAAFAAWNNGGGTNSPHYVQATTNANSSGILDSPDGVNNIVFEKNLTSKGANPYSCSMGGVLGIGGISVASTGAGSHMFNGETFDTTVEADVSMNQGLANCAFLNTGDWNTAVAHEVGHTLGFRHWDQNRLFTGACSSDPNLDCSGTAAIMKAFISLGLNAARQPWDTSAVTKLYTTGGAPGAPTITATAASSTSVTVTWAAVMTATSYDVYRKSPGGSFTFLTNTMLTSSTDNTAVANTAYLYQVIAKNGSGSSPSSNSDLATTVIFTDDPFVVQSTPIKAVHLTQLRTAVQAVHTLAGLGAITITDTTINNTVKVKAVHVTELRTALDAARSSLMLTALSYTNTLTATTTVVKAVDFQELRNGVK
jgi:hypothetical protein